MHCAIAVLTQIYVEIERARLTRELARMKEEEGDIAEAAEILQEVAVVSAENPRPLSCSMRPCRDHLPYMDV